MVALNIWWRSRGGTLIWKVLFSPSRLFFTTETFCPVSTMSFRKPRAPRARKQTLSNSPLKPSRSASPTRAADFRLVRLDPISLPQRRRSRNTSSLHVLPSEALLTLPGRREYTQLQQLRHSQRREAMYGDEASDIFWDDDDDHGLASEVHQTYGEDYYQLQCE